MNVEEAMAHRAALRAEIRILKSRFLDSGTGSIKTAVALLEARILEIDSTLKLKVEV